MKAMKKTFAKSARSIVATNFLATILCGSIGAVCGVILPFIGIAITTLNHN
jgi:hydrogenase/urease accessory protein HupE